MGQSSVDSTLNIFDRFAEEGSARLISDLGNPLFMPPAVLLATCLLINLSIPDTLFITITAVICFSLLPFLLTLFLFRRGFIHSLDLPIRKTRTALYGFSILSAIIAYLIIARLFQPAHDFVLVISLVLIANLSIAFLINLRWKVSVHSASVAIAGTIYGILYIWGISSYPLITLILSLLHLLLLLPVMMWARYRLNIHSLTELFGGATAGILLTVIELIIFTNLW